MLEFTRSTLPDPRSFEDKEVLVIEADMTRTRLFSDGRNWAETAAVDLNCPHAYTDLARTNLFMGGGVGNATATGTGTVGAGTDGVMRDVTTAVDCTAFGSGAMKKLQSGVGGSAFGRLSCSEMTVANGNTGFGDSTLRLTTDGQSNTAMGYTAGDGNLTGNRNTFLGGGAMRASPSGDDNTVVGNQGMFTAATAGQHRNSVFGADAGYNYQSIEMCAFGYRALYSATGASASFGIRNTAFGTYAGFSITTGNYNVFLGYSAGNGGSQKVDATNSIGIGRDVVTTKDNQVVIGNTSITETVLGGYVKFKVFTVATLTAAATAGAGAKAFVSDANATTFASIVAGGGSNGVPVYCDGTNWRIG